MKHPPSWIPPRQVEPIDQRTRDALSNSVQQAIEITTKSQEASARCSHLHFPVLTNQFAWHHSSPALLARPLTARVILTKWTVDWSKQGAVMYVCLSENRAIVTEWIMGMGGCLGRHDAERKAQEAVGVLERQKLKDEIEAEQTRRALLELQVRRPLLAAGCSYLAARAESPTAIQ